jgi:16S rRNA (adenine1518-N6/adenine1519-N6)-dimethyltransferase
MNTSERQTRSQLMRLFEDCGFHPRGDLGQNFLIDLNLLEFVVENAELGPLDVVLEVGAGTGGMTTFLAQQAGAVVSVEVDPRVHGLARGAVAGFRHVTLLLTDVLKSKNQLAPEVVAAVKRELAIDPERTLKLVANLPYSVATPVISNLVASDLPWTRMVVTIQLELADRMRAQPGTGDYGALAVWLQAQCRIKVLRKLPPSVFWPRPQVDSAIVRILPDETLRSHIADRGFFHDFVRRLFTQRRKLLRGVLAGMFREQYSKAQIDEILKGFSLKETARAEELDVETLVRLANTFAKSP